MKKTLLALTFACFGLTQLATAQTIALSQNFESAAIPGLPTGWSMTTVGGGQGWVTNSGVLNWPLYSITPHTTYAVVDDANHAKNNPANMVSPTFSLVGVTNPYLAYDWFYIHAWLNSGTKPHEQAWVEISSDGGTFYNFLDSVPGFSTSVTDWATQFVNLSSVSATANMKLRFCYADQGGGTTSTAGIIGVAVDNILVYGQVANDVALTSVTPVAGAVNDYFLTGSNATFGGTITNYGSAPISSITATYKVGTGAVVSNTISVSVPAMGTGTFSFSTPYNVATVGQKPVVISATVAGETNFANDTLTTAIIGVPFMPKKIISFEEATGTWCGWCVRGIVYMDSIWRAHPNDVAVISVHNGDPMASATTAATKYDGLMGNLVSGYPSMVVDRRKTNDPSGCFQDYATDHNLFGFANIGITVTNTGADYTAKVKLEPAVTMDGDYRLELIVTEDAVTGTGSGWLQHNYYAVGGLGNSTTMKTIGYNFNTLPTDISGIEFPFVARTTLPADLTTTPNGVAGSLPSHLHVGHLYTYDFAAITIPSTWVASKLRFVAMFIDNNPTSPTYGNILNCVTSTTAPGFTFIPVVGVSDVKAGIAEMKVYPNPATADAHVQFTLNSASKVQFTVIDAIGREVISNEAEQMTAGNHQINFATSGLAAGIYHVVVTTETGKLTQQLSVVR